MSPPLFQSILHFLHHRPISCAEIRIGNPIRFRIPFEIVTMGLRLDIAKVFKGKNQRAAIQRSNVRLASGNAGMEIRAVHINLHFPGRSVIQSENSIRLIKKEDLIP